MGGPFFSFLFLVSYTREKMSTTTAILGSNELQVKKQIVSKETKSYVHFIAGGYDERAL
jgi:hypothetical protein